jgi:hypothetical protein
MLEFKIANAALAAAVRRPQTAYKALPEHSTSAISSGLNRLFGTSATHEALFDESSPLRVSGQRREQEVSVAKQQEKARELASIHRELDEYLGEPLETFSKIETQADGIKRMVVFDILTYWQVCEQNSALRWQL